MEGIQILIHIMKCFIDDASHENVTSLCGQKLQYLNMVCSTQFVKYHVTYYTASIFSEEKKEIKWGEYTVFQTICNGFKYTS